MKKYHIEKMFTEEEVDARVEALAAQISKDYEGRPVHIICMLKGAAFFTCALAKRLTVPVTLDFMSASSYGSSTQSSGIVRINKDLDESIEGKDVLVIEDIIDTGRTLGYILGLLGDREPASLRLCVLLDKPDRRVVEVPVDYTGFEIPDEFVVGCGMDYDQQCRNLPYIGIVKFDED